MTISYIHIPAPRRRSSATLIDQAVVRLFRSAMDKDWTPQGAAPEVISAARGSSRLLRLARVRVLSRMPDYPTEIGVRALATLAVALRESGRR